MVQHMCSLANDKTMDRGKSKMNIEDLFNTLEELKFSKEDILEFRSKLQLFKDKEAVNISIVLIKKGKAKG